MGKNLAGLKRGFHWDPIAQDLGIYVNGIQVVSYTEVAGKKYFVNNITGSSDNDGSSWGNAYAQVSQAITAGAAYQAEQTSGNNIRNSIIIQGTSTKYTPISTMPLYTNVIGVGSDPRGNAFGNVRIGDSSDEADGAAGDEAGNVFYNIQFNGGGSFWAVDLGVSFSSHWENCAFGCASDNAASAGGVRILTAGSGGKFIDCDTIYHSGTPAFGMQIVAAGGSAFNDVRIENCMFRGTTAAFYTKAYLSGGTIVSHCTMIGGTYGVNDENTNTTPTAGITYTDNFAVGTTGGLTIDNGGTLRAIGNWVSDNGTADWLTTIAKS